MIKPCTACIPQIQVKDVKKTLYYRKRSKSKKQENIKNKTKKINKNVKKNLYYKQKAKIQKHKHHSYNAFAVLVDSKIYKNT